MVDAKLDELSINTIRFLAVDAVQKANAGHPGEESLARYAGEHKKPLPIGEVPRGCEVVTGEFWQGTFARHARRRLAYAVWGALSKRMFG